MTRTQDQNVAAPSKGALAKATGIALAVALVLLFTAVLPAEYGYDPLKTGALLGLTGIAKAGGDDVSKGRVSVTASQGQSAVYTAQAKTYKVDSEDFVLRPGEGMEMKYHMQKGAGMIYAWKANGKLLFEFHGEPDNKPNKDYFESYELDDKIGKTDSYGSFTAPSTGIHGWFWQNKTDKEVMLHLSVSGFIDSAKMMSDGEATDMPIDDAK
jgi:hypothetical protein